MAIRQKIKFLISASFWGIVIGLVALYYTLRGTPTNLVVDVVSESNVMDVRTPLKDLSILFQGQDIQKENANLRILGVRVVNEGEANILESHFDSKIPWGLHIEGGHLIEARVTGSNSEYLSNTLHPRVTGNDEVTFDKVIFDKGKYVALELLVLHNKNTEPTIKPLGKIAGMDTIPIRQAFRDQDQEGFKSKVFRGPIAVQIARTIAYFVIGFLAAAILGVTIAGIGSIPSRLKKRSRRRFARYLPKEGSTEKEKKRQALLDIFVEDGLHGLKRVQRMLDSEELKAKAFRPRRVSVDDAAEFGPHLIAHMHTTPVSGYIYVPSPLESLVEAGLVRRTDKTIEVDAEARDLLSNLIGQLSEFDDEHDDLPKTGNGHQELEKGKR